MNRETFKKIIDQYKLLEEYIDKYEEIGINLYEGKYPAVNVALNISDLLWESIYSEEGIDWINWFLYEKDFNGEHLDAYDKDGNLICYDVDSLYDFIEQYKLC